MNAVEKWNALPQQDKNWNNFKQVFVQAYELRLDSGPTAGAAGYHGAANTIADDDDSLGSIVGSLNQMQMANNANAQAFSDNLNTIETSTNELRQALVATQQQLAALAQAVQQPYQAQFNPPPMSQPAYNTANAATPAPGAFAPPPPPPQQPTQYNSAWRGGGRAMRGRGGRYGRGRGGRGRGRNNLGFQPQPPQSNQGTGTVPALIPPPLRTQSGTQQNRLNYYKRYNNWNVCYSCGWDVPSWHTSATCPPECRKYGHQEGFTRNNADAYIQAGHNPSTRGRHKNMLPQPGYEWGE